jgi:hemerythrin superfamily protein
MNPYELLKNDHEKVSDLFERIESTSGKEKLAAFKKLKAELDVHALIEETIFYPALKNSAETRDITLEGYEEHRVVKDLLAELAGAKLSDKWDAKFMVLKENVEHHVDEEESDLFKKAKDVLSSEQAEALGDQMAAEKERQGAPVPAELEQPGLIKRVVNTLFGGPSDSAEKKKKAGKSAAKKTANASSKKSGVKKVSSKKSGSKKTTAKKASKKSTKRTRTVTTARAKKAAKKSPPKARAKAA